MTLSLDTDTQAAAADLLTLMGQTVTYKLQTHGVVLGTGEPALSSNSRTITAIVRYGTEGDKGFGTTGPELRVHIRNDSTLGVAASEVNLGADVISLASRIGKTATDHRITEILTQNPTWLVLRCL